LEDGWLLETEGDLMGGKGLVAVGNSGESIGHGLSIEWVEVDFLDLSAVGVDSHGSTSDVGWEALYFSNFVSLSFI